MQLISHRGAKGLKTENTLDSIRIAARVEPDFIEFDVHRTKDKRLVVFHDNETPKKQLLAASTLAELRAELPTLPLLLEALRACGETAALVEFKSVGTAELSTPFLEKFPSAAVASFIQSEAVLAKKNLPAVNVFLLQHAHPFGLVKKAVAAELSGIGVNKNWAIILPFLYWKAERQNLALYTYTVNSPTLAAIFLWLMPNLAICTDNPHKLKPLTYSRDRVLVHISLLATSLLGLLVVGWIGVGLL